MTGARRIEDAGAICSYCGRARLDGTQRAEHPIPAVLDSKITVFTVCDECNTRAGRQVDAPWLSHPFVLDERARNAVADPRRSRSAPPGSILDGVYFDEEGHRVVVHGGVPRYTGSIVDDGERIRITAPDEARAAEMVERVEKRLAAEGYAGEIQSINRRRHRPRLSRTITASLDSGVRFGAKAALAFAAEAFPEEWRLAPEADQLRAWLWSEDPQSAEGNKLAWLAGGEEHPYAEPPRHTVFFLDLHDAVHLVALVFGRLGFAVPVAPLDLGVPTVAWMSGPGHKGAVLTDDDALLGSACERFIVATAADPANPAAGPPPSAPGGRAA